MELNIICTIVSAEVTECKFCKIVLQYYTSEYWRKQSRRLKKGQKQKDTVMKARFIGIPGKEREEAGD